jgi:cytochrome c peroxidase
MPRVAPGGTAIGWRLAAVALAACAAIAAASRAGIAEAPAEPAARAAWQADYQRPAQIPFPADNPYSAAKAALGRLLFFDPLLSGPRTIACASCHNPGLSWGDGLARAQGVGKEPLALRSPTMLNIAWIGTLGWDGKFPSLEGLTFAPITGPGNMNEPAADLPVRLAAIPGYVAAFAAAFPDGAVDRRNIELALATFERTIVSGEAPFDRWIAGDESAIGAAAKRGFDLFNDKAQCSQCHVGWNFTEGAFYDIGAAAEDDLGRGRIFANSPKLRHAFKVPTLRDTARRGPFLHDGSAATLAAVIELYDHGGIARDSRSELIRPLGLSAAEKADLVAFLDTLSAPLADYPVPVLPR